MSNDMLNSKITSQPNSMNATKKSSVELIKYDEKQKFCYYGYCKIQINLLSKVVSVHPINKNYKNIKAPFKCRFICQKNILFVFGEFNLQHFALIFDSDRKCQKAYNGIFKNRSKDYISQKCLHQRFLNLMFEGIRKTNDSRTKDIMQEWIQKHDRNERKNLLELLNKNGNNGVYEDIKQENECNGKTRKRRYSQTTANNNNNELFSGDKENVAENEDNDVEESGFENHPQKKIKRNSRKENLKIIDESYFKIVKIKNQKSSGYRRKVLTFTTADKTFCYEFSYYSNKRLLYHRCRNDLRPYKAILEKDENGKECIKMDDLEHQCKPIKYDPKIYMELKIVKKPDYELIENGTKRFLIIFDENDRSQCYEYFWSSDISKFVCCGCSNGKSKRTKAELCNEGTDGEYIRLLKDKHGCEKRNYNPSKFHQTNQFLLKPDFEIQTKIKNGKELKVLIIFDKNDRSLCFVYHHIIALNTFNCNGCKRLSRSYGKEKSVSAKVTQNSDDEEYVILSNAEHICSPIKYLPQSEIIIRPPNVKLLAATEKHTSKLIIFDSANPKLCYTFSQRLKENYYYCLGCAQKLKSIKMEKRTKKHFSAYMFQEDNSEEFYVKIDANQKHLCKPKKYEPEKNEIVILKPKLDYFLFRAKDAKSTSLAIYVSNKQQDLCYKYYYGIPRKLFVCWACEKQKHYISAKIDQDFNGNEYVTVSKKEHVCTPFKVTAIKAGATILEKSGLTSFTATAAEEPKKTENKVDEKRIVRLPSYKLEKGRDGVADKKLFIFTSDDQNLCYEYRCDGENYYCKKCRAPAKLHENDGNKYIILGEKNHECEPIKYEPAENKIITASNFVIFNRDNEKKRTKLIIFTSSTKEKCYEYTFNKQAKVFQCGPCDTLKLKVSAKLVQNNSEEYIQLLKNEHICTPKKFILEIYQPKIVPQSQFKIMANQNGKPKLIIFDAVKNGYGYEYFLEKNNLFVCRVCNYRKKRVTAKLMEDEKDGKHLELSPNEHICQSIKL